MLSLLPAANTRSGSDPDRYMPPHATSWLCIGTAPPSNLIFPPMPCVLGARPFNRTATRGAQPWL